MEKQNDNNFISGVINEIEKNKPDGIYVFLNGNLADDFFRSIHRENLKVPVIASSFAVEDIRLVNIGYAANNIYNFNTWNKNIDNEENRIFVSGYKKKFNNEPSQFGFLGYETGLLINNSLSACNGNFTGAGIAESISGCNIKSPGGNIAVNKKSGMVSNPIYLCKTQPALFNLHENKIVSKYNSISEFDEIFASFDSGMRSGWLNPYLFV